MSFDRLAPQSPINPEADRYGAQCLELSREVASTWLRGADVRYGPEPEHTLDVYGAGAASLPEIRGAEHAATRDANVPVVPVLLFLHGGGFTHGYKEWCGFMAPAIAPAVLVAVRYRLLPSVAYPTPWFDVLEALSWVKQHIGEYGGDPARVFLGGHSAGGALASTLSGRRDWLAERGLSPESVAGTVCVSTTFNRFAISGSPASAYGGPAGPLVVDPDTPLARLDEARGRYFIAWGGRERQRERVERSSMAMICGLRDRGHEVEWHLLETADHFGTHLAFADPEHPWSHALRSWLLRPLDDRIR